MATRFYFPSTGTPSVSPAFDGTVWTGGTLEADRRTMVTGRITSAMTDKASTSTAVTADTRELVRQYISEELEAQTLSGSFKGQLRGRGQTAGSRGMALRLCKLEDGGSTVTQILAITFSDDVGSLIPPAFDTTSINRRFETGSNDFVLDFTDMAFVFGDRLMLEIGVHSGSSSSGRQANLSFGDDHATDLAENETETLAHNPWVEFTDDILFAPSNAPLVGRIAHQIIAPQHRYPR